MTTNLQKEIDNQMAKFEEKFPNFLHEFQREFNKKDVMFNDLPPLERRAIKEKYTNELKSFLSQSSQAIVSACVADFREMVGEMKKECLMCKNFESSHVGHDFEAHTHNRAVDDLLSLLDNYNRKI